MAASNMHITSDAFDLEGTDNSGVADKLTSMTDTTKNFVTEGVEVGDIIVNTTDLGSGVITSITTTTNTNDTLNFSGGLTGGTENDFDDADGYLIYKDGASWSNPMSLLGFWWDYKYLGEAGDVYYVYTGTYTLTKNFDSAMAGTDALACQLTGISDQTNMTVAEGDDCPSFVCGAYDFEFYNYWKIKAIRGTSTNANGFLQNSSCIVSNVKFENTSGTTGRAAIRGGRILWSFPLRQKAL